MKTFSPTSKQWDRALVRLIRDLDDLAVRMQRMGATDMGLLAAPQAGKFHRATKAIGDLAYDLSQDVAWPHEPGEGLQSADGRRIYHSD
jgi:hypothetical protein